MSSQSSHDREPPVKPSAPALAPPERYSISEMVTSLCDTVEKLQRRGLSHDPAVDDLSRAIVRLARLANEERPEELR